MAPKSKKLFGSRLRTSLNLIMNTVTTVGQTLRVTLFADAWVNPSADVCTVSFPIKKWKFLGS